MNSSTKQMLGSLIDEAWNNYNQLHEAEAATGYDDAMDGFERKEAEGYALGLETAYQLVFNEAYISSIDINFYPDGTF